ncbi:MAG: DEAD/DEAH box helicase, partial [Planctomycetes bacterium]|nr:DEAD/DEAH box helicase [Planctomycetota bacterium]
RATGSERQTLLFSATLHREVEVLAEHVLRDPQRIETDPPNKIVRSIRDGVVRVKPSAKAAMVGHLLKLGGFERALVFVASRARAIQFAEYLNGQGLKSLALQGAMSQRERKRVLEDYRAGKHRILVATDIASRGLDIDDIELVVHADAPMDPLDYVHRSGRSARMGRSGKSVLLVSDEEVPRLEALSEFLGGKPQDIDVPGFDFEGEYAPLPSVIVKEPRPASKAKAKRGPSKGEREKRRQKGERVREAKGSFKVRSSKSKPSKRPAARPKSAPRKRKP